MNIFDLQKFLFEHTPSRLELVGYTPPTVHTTYTVSVYRNHSFELVEHTISAYLDYAQITVRFEYSDYDDSLSFSRLDDSADLIILWLDISRYKIENVHGFIEQRMSYLSGVYKKNILVVLLYGEGYTFSIPGVYAMDWQPVKEKLGVEYIDERLEMFSGTKLSSHALMEISKNLALQYLPALLRPPIKAIVVDLDNTLYQGILGEDGISGVVLTDSHRMLQDFLLKLSENGFLVCAVSKNNHDDVKKMFDIRNDFPVKWETFVKVRASWDSKSSAIRGLLEYLNINEDSMVFIDDNIGEIIEVMSVFPGIKVIHAALDAAITCKILMNFPGMFRFGSQHEDYLRKSDIQANEKRQELRQALSPCEYIKSLNMKLTYKIDNHNDILRIVELANKTNQFIFSYKRYTNTQILECMENEKASVVSIFLKDNLSDSGLIGSCVVVKAHDEAVLDEFFVSCRALGRGVEEIIILNAIKFALDRLGTALLRVNFLKGERNTPAEIFINQHLNRYLQKSAVFNFQNNQNLVGVCLEG